MERYLDAAETQPVAVTRDGRDHTVLIAAAEYDRLMQRALPLSERDSLRVFDLLENPSAAPDRLVRSAKLPISGPDNF